MEEKTRALVGCISFLIIVLVIGIGGYFYTFKNDKHLSLKNNKEEISITDDNKIDKSKDFIYYSNDFVVSNDLNIAYKNPIINLSNNQAEELTQELSNKNDEYINNVKKISSTTNDTGKEIAFDTDDIYSATVRDYENYEYLQYISLVVSNYEYDCFDGVKEHNLIESYVFDVVNNKKISNIDVLDIYNISLAEVKTKIKEKLESEQTIENDVETIKIDETINNFENDNTYGIYINNNGKLVIKYIVKTNVINYNDIIEID